MTKRLICRAVVGLCLSCFLAATFYMPGIQAEEDDKELQFDDILRLLDSSEKQYSYLGTKFVIDYTPTRRSTTLVKVTYGAAGWQKKEVAPLKPGEPPQIILEDGKFLWHYIPSQASVVKKKQRMSLGTISKRIYSQSQLIEQNYDISIKRQPQTASLIESEMPLVSGDIMVSFQSKTHDRPSWKIWLESEYGLIVRTEVYDVQGNLAILSAFSDLTFQPKLSEKAFVMTVPKGTKMQRSLEKHFRTIEEAQTEVSFSILEPHYLPSGFILSSVIQSEAEQGEKVQLTYLDGMSSISVFQEQRAEEVTSTEKASKEVEINTTVKGTFHDHGLLKILRWQIEQKLLITLVGEVADTELLKIAASITP